MTRDDGLRSPMYAGSWPYTLYTGTNDYLIEKGTHDVHAFVDWLRLLVERLPSRGRYAQAGVLTGAPENMKIPISLVRPLKCRISASVGLWNEGMTNSLTVDKGSQKLFPVIWGRFCRPVVQGRGST